MRLVRLHDGRQMIAHEALVGAGSKRRQVRQRPFDIFTTAEMGKGCDRCAMSRPLDAGQPNRPFAPFRGLVMASEIEQRHCDAGVKRCEFGVTGAQTDRLMQMGKGLV